MNTAAATRAGRVPARMAPQDAPCDTDMIVALSKPTASSTATASSANADSAYSAGSLGRSEAPLSRPSKVMTV